MGLAAVLALAIPVGPILGAIAEGGDGKVSRELHALGVWVPFTFLVLGVMLTALLVGHRWVPAAGPARKAAQAVLVVALASVGVLAGIVAHRIEPLAPDTIPHLDYTIQWNLTFAFVFVLGLGYVEQTRSATDATHAAELQRAELEKELAGAQLLLLQAQAEPHFLFNTLANLRRLVRTDRAAARAMLADLMRYLEVALPRLRDQHSTLASEMALLQAYLALHQVRMGARLRTEFDVPDALGARKLPPMLLLTLVENAIKHGVQPLVDGALVRVEARSRDGFLEITVSDTGAGMGSGSGGGSGLANLRARLKAMYGARASLRLGVNEPRGLVATIVVPESAP